MKKLFIIGLSFLLYAVCSLTYAEEVTITTYYPAPEGVYDTLQANNYYGYPLTQVPGEPANTYYGVAPKDTSYLNDLIITGSLDLGGAEIIANKFTDSENYANYYLDPANTDTSLIVAGSVGVGTRIISDAKLQVQDATNPIIRIGQISSQTTNIKIGGIEFSNNGAPAYTAKIESYAGSFTNYNDLRFYTTNIIAPIIPVERMRIAYDGNVGIGEVAPGSKLSVSGGATIGVSYDTTAAPSNGMIIEGSVGIGTTSPTTTLDTAGVIHVHATNVSPDNGYNGLLRITREGLGSAQYINLIRSGQYPWSIGTVYNLSHFAIGQGAQNDFNFSPFFFITTAGQVGCGGYSTLGYRLHVAGDAYATGRWIPGSSDLRLKKNIEELSGVLEKLENIKAVKFDWRVDEFPQRGLSQEKQIGLIAQEVEKGFPELVLTENDGYKALDYDRFTAVLLAAVKELNKENDALKKRLEALEAKLNVK